VRLPVAAISSMRSIVAIPGMTMVTIPICAFGGEYSIIFINVTPNMTAMILNSSQSLPNQECNADQN